MSNPTDVLCQHVAAAHADTNMDSLPPDCYRSPEFFEVERERIFEPAWISVAHVSQVRNPGDYVCQDLLNESLVITRDQDDAIHVLSRVCLHRWTQIVTGSGNADRFVCPFHAWTYALDGQLTGAPVTRDEPGFEMARCRLPEFRHEIHDGFVLVNLSGDATSPDKALEPLKKRFHNYNLENLQMIGVLEYECAYDWKILVETFMESYHHIGIHTKTLEPLYPARTSFMSERSDTYVVLDNPVKPGLETAGDELLPLMNALAAHEVDRFVVYNVFPFHLVALFPNLIAWFRVNPTGAGRCQLAVHVLVEPDVAVKLDETARQEALGWIDVINREDIAVNVSQQRGLLSVQACPGRLNQLEQANAAFAAYLRESIATH